MLSRITIEEAKEILKGFFEGEWQSTNQDIGPTSILIKGIVRQLFLVGQTISFQIESERGHLWSPKSGYPKMKSVNAGDIILSYQNGEVKSVNISLCSAEETYGEIDGLQIDCLYSILDFPVDIVPLRPKLAGLEPFGPDGNLPRRGYIHSLYSFAAWLIHNEIIKIGNTYRR